jgi:RNA polymerase sigma factor (sigma-70 family)
VVTDDWLLEEFEASRPRLRGLAYRMLGSHADADDAVQETWLRLQRNDREQIENIRGLLTTMVGRVCLDRLRARRARREDTESDAMDSTAVDSDPIDAAVLAESIGSALLVVVEMLTPAERVAFVLHDVFAVPFDEIAVILDRSPEATRQLASRARRRVQGGVPTVDVDLVRHRDVVDAFLRAARGGNFDELMRVLDPDVALVPDLAAERMGALRKMHGATSVASALAGGAQGAQLAVIDGVAGFVWAPTGRVRGVVEFDTRDGKIVAIRVTGDQSRIRSLDIVLLDG